MNKEKKKYRYPDYQHQWYLNNRDRLLEKTKQYQQQNKEKIRKWRRVYYQRNKEKAKEQSKKWYIENKEKALLDRKEWRDKNQEKIKKYGKEWRKKNKGYFRKWYKKKENKLKKLEYNKRFRIKNKNWVDNYRKEYIKKNRKRLTKYYGDRRKLNPKIRLDWYMGNMIRTSLKGKKANRKWQNLVEFSLENLIKHLEKQFDDKMNWENYGSYWHLDHIKQKNLFKYEKVESPEFKKCWALENLRPLEAKENLRRHKKDFPT